MDNKFGFGGKKRDLKKNHKRSTGDVFILVKRRDQGAKRRGLLALKAWERKEAEDECQAAVVHHGLPQDIS